MPTKTCFKCAAEKNVSEFYKHSQMADGYLNKCKECARGDALRHRGDNLDKVRAYDRMRGGLTHRIENVKRYQQTEVGKEKCRAAKSRYYYSDTRKSSSRTLFSNAVRDGKVIREAVCSQCSNPNPQAHHENYDHPLEVVWLCSRCHANRHKEMRKLGIKP